MNVLIKYMLYTWLQLLILCKMNKTLPENNTHTHTHTHKRVFVCVMHVNFIISYEYLNMYATTTT